MGLDIQDGMPKKFVQRVSVEGLTEVRTILGGLGHGFTEKNEFDECFLVTVLVEIPENERTAALRELYDSLKPDGNLTVTEFFPDPHHQSRDIALHLARASGFAAEKQYGSWAAFTVYFAEPESN